MLTGLAGFCIPGALPYRHRDEEDYQRGRVVGRDRCEKRPAERGVEKDQQHGHEGQAKAGRAEAHGRPEKQRERHVEQRHAGWTVRAADYQSTHQHQARKDGRELRDPTPADTQDSPDPVPGDREKEHVVESQQRYQLATMAGNVSVWEWDLETDHLYVDPGLKRTLGYAEDEIPDTLAAWRAHVPPKDVALMRAAARAHLNGVTPHYDVEHRLLHRNGAVRWFHLGAVSARRGDRAVRMSGTEVDITDRRQAAEELRVARLNLAHASRLALVGELMASISHEIKQPLTSILSNAGAGLRLLRVDPRTIQGVDLGEIFRDVCDDTRRAADIIERLRTLARKRPLQLIALDVNDVVNDILRLVGSDARRRGVTLRAELVPSLPAVAADPVCLQQVMLNLILNATEAMEHTAATTNDREVVVLTRGLDDAVEVVVRDTGPGISADRLPAIFDAFVTTKRDGLGLGLAVARSIVDSHGGRLWAEDRAGHGATFRLTLPVLGPR